MDFYLEEAPTEATKGDLYIANSTGQFQSITYRPGDWLVCVNPPSTDPNAPDEEWLKVNNTGSVVGFQGAKDNTPREGSISPEANDYTWEMIGKENAKLNDLTDVDLSLGAGDTLKFVELDRNLDGVIDFRGWTLGPMKVARVKGPLMQIEFKKVVLEVRVLLVQKPTESWSLSKSLMVLGRQLMKSYLKQAVLYLEP